MCRLPRGSEAAAQRPSSPPAHRSQPPLAARGTGTSRRCVWNARVHVEPCSHSTGWPPPPRHKRLEKLGLNDCITNHLDFKLTVRKNRPWCPGVIVSAENTWSALPATHHTRTSMLCQGRVCGWAARRAPGSSAWRAMRGSPLRRGHIHAQQHACIQYSVRGDVYQQGVHELYSSWHGMVRTFD
jgi:hypothetical protein